MQMAEGRSDSDPAASAAFRAAAAEQTREGLADLRDLAAGIHPGVLTDQGLHAAVDALASRMPIPVTVVANLEDRRLPEPMEASVYFFVSESLANVVKHARATHAEVKLCIEGEDLVVDVRDDGVGGAAHGGRHRAGGPRGPHRRAGRRPRGDEPARGGDGPARHRPARLTHGI